MDVLEVDISKIIPYEHNNRKHPTEQIQRIAKSISSYGFNQPIVVDENNIILVGHGRFFAAHSLNLQQVPVVIKKGLDEKSKKAYRILDNKLQNDSYWDMDNLTLELNFLEDNNFNLEEWGLDDLLPSDDEESLEDLQGEGSSSLKVMIQFTDRDNYDLFKLDIEKLLKKYQDFEVSYKE